MQQQSNQPSEHSTLGRRGQVIWFNETKGFGFIKPECSVCRRPIDKNHQRCDVCGFVTEDVFVHYSAIATGAPGQPRNLNAGQLVEFDIVPGDRGKPMAHQVRVVKFDDPRRAAAEVTQ